MKKEASENELETMNHLEQHDAAMQEEFSDPNREPQAADFESIGDLVDTMYKLDKERQAQQRRAEDIKKQVSKLKKLAISMMEEQGLTGAKGRVASITIATVLFPRVADKEEFYRFVVKNGRFELTQSRLNAAAFEAALSEGNMPEGCEVHSDWKVTSLKKK